MGRLSLVEEVFLNLLVVVRAPEVVGDCTFIRLKMTSQSALSVGKNNKTRTNDVSLNLFIKCK
jgi:hypothetical protein